MNAASNPDSDRWQEIIASAVGAFPPLPQADETLTERHELLDQALNGEGADEAQDVFVWDGTYETGNLFEALEKQLASHLVPDRPTSDLPSKSSTRQAPTAKKTSAPRKSSTTKKASPTQQGPAPTAPQQASNQQGN